jgi:hypothetical protein
MLTIDQFRAIHDAVMAYDAAQRLHGSDSDLAREKREAVLRLCAAGDEKLRELREWASLRHDHYEERRLKHLRDGHHSVEREYAGYKAGALETVRRIDALLAPPAAPAPKDEFGPDEPCEIRTVRMPKRQPTPAPEAPAPVAAPSDAARFIEACARVDWMQMLLNGAGGCFRVEENGRLCGRAPTWAGHVHTGESCHLFEPLYVAVTRAVKAAAAAAGDPVPSPSDAELLRAIDERVAHERRLHEANGRVHPKWIEAYETAMSDVRLMLAQPPAAAAPGAHVVAAAREAAIERWRTASERMMTAQEAAAWVMDGVRLMRSAPPAPAGDAALREAPARIVGRVAELPDRCSPEEWPEAMLVTGDELAAIVREEIDALLAPPAPKTEGGA